MGLLAVLLLICTLMAGAVSADTEFNQASFTDGNYTISSAGTYVLNETAAGNISITPSTGEVIVKAKNNAQLTGTVWISTSASLTVQDMDIVVNKSVMMAPDKPHVISVPSPADNYHPRIILKDSTITFDDDMKDSRGYAVLVQTYIVDGSAFISNTINNVPDHAVGFQGVADGGTVTVSGNTVTMNPKDNINPQDLKKGRALFKVWFMPSYLVIHNDVTFTVTDNVVSHVSGATNKIYVVRVDEINGNGADPKNDNKIIVKMTNNTLDDDPGSPYMFGGISSVYGEVFPHTQSSTHGGYLKELRVNLTDDIAVLTPDLNQTGVKWNGGDVEIIGDGKISDHAHRTCWQ